MKAYKIFEYNPQLTAFRGDIDYRRRKSKAIGKTFTRFDIRTFGSHSNVASFFTVVCVKIRRRSPSRLAFEA
jgi:hypothetical protein